MKTKIILFTIAFLAIVFTANAQTYFVSTNGNDLNPGTQTLPFATIQKGIDAATSPGSIIYVTAGTYSAGLTFQINSGSTTTPITLKNYNNDMVYIDGNGVQANVGTAMATMNNVSGIVIDGINFQNAINNQVKGILIGSGCSDITIRNCTFSNIHFSNNPSDIPISGQGTSPFIVYGTSASATIHNIRFTNNKVYNCRTGQSEAITLTGNVNDFTIDSNQIYNIGNIGIDIAGHWGVCNDPLLDQARNGIIKGNTLYNCLSPVTDNGQIYVDGGRDVIIENNICYDGSIGIVAGCENLNKAANNITIRNNILYHNQYTGIQVGTANNNSENKKVINTTVSGNTCYNNDFNSIYAGQMVFKYCDSTLVMNNIMTSPNNAVIFTYYYSTGLGNKFDYNLYWTPSGTNSTFNYWQNPTAGYYNFTSYQNGTGQDIHSKCANPTFVNESSNDFHLLNNSPAINAGDPLYTPQSKEVDMDGLARAIGIIDCGADESNYNPGTVKEIQKQIGIIYPNPSNGTITYNTKLGNRSGTAYMYVINPLGQILHITKADVKDGNINHQFTLSDKIPEGIYILRIEYDGSYFNKQFSIVR